MIWISGQFIAAIVYAVGSYAVIVFLVQALTNYPPETTVVIAFWIDVIIHLSICAKMWFFPSPDRFEKKQIKEAKEYNNSLTPERIKQIGNHKDEIRRRRIDYKKQKAGFTGTESKLSDSWSERHRAGLNELGYFISKETGTDVEKLIDQYMELKGIEWTKEDEEKANNIPYNEDDIFERYSLKY